jgi:hypothetical protein
MSAVPTPADMAALSRRPLAVRPVQAAVPGPSRVARPLPAAAAAPVPPGAPPRRRWEASVQHSTLPANARLVALTLATYPDWAEWPADGPLPELEIGVARISRDAGLSHGTVRQTLKQLHWTGWLRRTITTSNGSHAVIRLLLPPARE